MCVCFDQMLGEERSACFDDTRSYRYALWKIWDRSKPLMASILLNPSSADENVLDPTLTRVVGYAKAWDMGGIIIGNAFALRSTDPSALLENPAAAIGRQNDDHILGISMVAGRIMVGWGTNLDLQRLNFRTRQMRTLLKGAEVWAWGATRSGQPKHPLYLRADTPAQPYVFPA